MRVKPYQSKYNFVTAFKVSGAELVQKPKDEQDRPPSTAFDTQKGEGLIQFADHLPYNFSTLSEEQQWKVKEREALPWVKKFLEGVFTQASLKNPRLKIELLTITATAYE